MVEPRPAMTDEQLDTILGNLLRGGVLLAAAVVAAGGALYLYRHAGEPVPSYRKFSGEPEEYRSVTGILTAAMQLRGRGIIQLGLLLLIATPVARVVFSVVAFAVQRDWLYVAVTAVVLAVLLYSLFTGGA